MIGGQDADPRRRRLGARLLPELPEPPARLPRGVVERRRLERRRREARRGPLELSARPTRGSGACGRRPRPESAAAPRPYSMSMDAAVAFRADLPSRRRSGEHPRDGPGLPHRRRAARAHRRRRPSRVRGALPPLRALGARHRAAADGRPWPRRGRDPGHVRERLAIGVALRPGPRPACVVAVHRRAQRDRGRPAPDARPDGGRPARDRRRATRARPTPPRPSGCRGASTGRSRRCPSTSARSSSSRTGAASRRARSPEYLGLPLGTVKTRTRAALRRLAGELEDELG